MTCQPNLDRALDLVQRMMGIAGPSGAEGRIIQFIIQKLRRAGLASSAIQTDRAHRKSPLGGEVGNLMVKLPGSVRGPRRLLMAHVDTVPICVGCQPVRRGRWIRSADANTGLGADNRAGAAVVLSAALEILEHKLPHPPLTLLWPVQEEVGLMGARHLSVGRLGRPRLAFNFDGGSPAKITLGATGAYRLSIQVHGLAAHAGAAPQQGVSAVAIASLAIADLHRHGYHGLIEKGRHRGTCNVGIIQAGQATNVVTPHALVRAEARSHDPRFRKRIVARIRKAFTAAAASVRNVAGQCGHVEFQVRPDYEAFKLDRREPCVRMAAQAVRALGAEPIFAVTDGGLDANWMCVHGIPTVTLGAGQHDQHTVTEALNVPDFQRAVRLGLILATTDIQG